MLDITTYLDESQINNPGHLVVSGFYGTDQQWTGLANDWKVGLGQRKGLHMTDLHWGGEAAKRRLPRLLAKLGALPHKHGLTPIYGAVKVSDYADLIAREPRHNNKVILNGYVICLTIIVVAMMEEIPAHARIKLVCERQDYYQGLAEMYYRIFAKEMARRYPTRPYFESEMQYIEKGSSVLTQPSDFLSFAKTKYLDERGSRKDLWCRPIFGNKKPDEILGGTHDRDTARKVIAIILKASKSRTSLYQAEEFYQDWRGEINEKKLK